MKQIFTLLFAVLAFTACTQNDVEELTANRADVPEILTIGFEGDDTRIQLNEAQKTVWNAGDEVSVFYKSYDNLKFQFQGKTGDRSGTLKMVDGEVGAQTMGHVVVVYPYSTSYRVSDGYSGIEAILPATQTYLNGSYGVGENLMVAQSEFTQFSLKNVCGWLKIQLTGNGERVQSLTLRGNNEEQLAGLIYVDTATAESTLVSKMGGFDDMENSVGGSLIPDDAIVTEITLNCGEGVMLGSAAKSFYIAVPPQTFEKGFTVEVECDNGTSITKSTSEPIAIERNHIKPMEAIALEGEAIVSYNEIHYTATAKVEANSNYPWTFDTFGANVVSNEWDSESGEGVITFDADVTTIGQEAFDDCASLTSITIPDSVTTIGEWAFVGCYSLTSITIPDSVTTIGYAAFAYCDSLTNAYCEAMTPPSLGGSYVFYNNTSGRKIYVPAASVEAYKTADYWSEYADAIIAYDFENGVVVEPEVSINNVIHYTATAKVEAYSSSPWSFDTFGANIVSNEWDSESGEGVITFDTDVTTIGNGAFYDCDSLISITIPDSLTTIGGSAFYDCNSLISITIPDSVTTIGNSAFWACYSLTSVCCEATTPPSLGEYHVFYNNASGRKIYVPAESIETYKSAEGWSDYVDAIVGFDFSITSIINYTTFDGQIVNARLPIISNTYSNGIGTIEFWGSIIHERAFYDCSSLTSVTIPDSVTTIGSSAFENCYRLTSVTIPDSVTTIGDYTFYYCDSLTSVTIGDSVTTIGDSAFHNCTNLTNVYISDIAAWCRINFESSSANPLFCGANLYLNNELVTDLTISDSVTTIGEYAFADCDSLTSVTIGNSVTTIGEYAFYCCYSLTSVCCEATTPPSLGGSSVFDGNASDRTIYVPVESVRKYKIAEGWSEYADYIVGYDFSTTSIINYTTSDDQIINTYLPIISNTYSNGVGTIEFWGSIIHLEAFYDCDSLTSITIGDSVTTIGDYAFYDCDSLTSVTIGNSVTTIGEDAFYSCHSLTNVYISDIAAWCNINFVSSSANPLFYGANLYLNNELVTDLTIPYSVTTIGESAFKGCNSLTSVTIPDSVTTIGERAFYDCVSLTSITIPDSVTTIGEEAFANCDSLTEFNGKFASEDGRCLIVDGTLNSFAPAGLTAYTIPNSVTTIGDFAFYDCYSLTSITIPDSVTTIGDDAFYNCKSLTSVTIPDSVTTIGNSAFNWCWRLTSVYCEATTPPSLGGSSVFKYTDYERLIYVPAESVEAYKSAENWSEYADAIIGYDFENGVVVE